MLVQHDILTTDEIAQATVLSPLYTRPDADLREAWVSSKSRWYDAVWDLDYYAPGHQKSKRCISWRVEFSDGTFLTDAAYADTLDWLRRIVWSLFTGRARGAPHSPGSAGGIAQGMRAVVRWLVETKRYNLADLTCAASWEFLYDFMDLIGAEDRATLTESQVKPAISFVQKVWIQASVVNILKAREAPFDGLSVSQVIAKVTSLDGGRIPPLPDEVAVPILNEAAAFVEYYSNDILDLFRGVRSTQSSSGASMESHHYVQRKVAVAFSFGVLEGATEPWHPPICSKNTISTVTHLVRALRAACIIVIMATTGMRISEVCGIRSGTNPINGLPICIEKRRAEGGLFDLFLLKAKLTKTERTPRTVEWVVGMTPAGSSAMPLAVRALDLVNKLAEIGDLSGPMATSILSGRISMIKGKDSQPPSNLRSFAVQNMIKRFVEDWVDLSGLPEEGRYAITPNNLVEWRESKGRIIRTHQFRKTFAQFAAAIDARLVEAVKDQFKHISLAMTLNAYVNSEQHVELTSMDANRAARTVFEMIRGNAPLAGIMGEQIEQHLPSDFRAEVESLPPSEAWKKVVMWTEQNGFRLMHAPHGSCGGALNPTKMRCHEVAGTVDWMAQEPNYQTREPSLCAGCPCFVVDAQHVPFWRERYRDNYIAVLAAKRAGISADYRAIQSRADQARNFLKRLGDDITALDQNIEAELAKRGLSA